ncbi:hypothetical protein SDC9_162069 [bioreactor metagenome]|uniref:Uncharacterized protein n=1 Tax=bioreactor metagenome TaxID=1076179 RepID=A0A645FLC4_9ZZZZ
MRLAGPGGHKEINRTNLTAQQAQQALCQPVVRRQLELLRFRNRCAAFGFDAQLAVSCPKPHMLELQWSKAGAVATLCADLQSFAFTITGQSAGGEPTFSFEQQA